MVPQGALVLDNHNGTAPGLIIEKNGKTAILLPGPPNELKPMFEEEVFHISVKNSRRSFILRWLKSAPLEKARWQRRSRI